MAIHTLIQLVPLQDCFHEKLGDFDKKHCPSRSRWNIHITTITLGSPQKRLGNPKWFHQMVFRAMVFVRKQKITRVKNISWNQHFSRGVAAVWKVEGLRGVLFFQAIFYCIFGRFGKMTHLVNLKKCRGSSPGCPGGYYAPELITFKYPNSREMVWLTQKLS